ncbi:hypothetical protein SLS53_009541, partial [Cytospora paraplurivora]
MARIPPQPLPRMLAANEIVPTMERIIANRKAVHEAVANTVMPETASFQNVIRPWLEAEDRDAGIWQVIDMYRYAAPDQATRDAAEEATRLMSERGFDHVLRRDLYLLVKGASERDDAPDEESKKAVSRLLREFEDVGHGKLSPEQRKKYLETRKEIDRLCQMFNQNLREKTEGIWFKPEELSGVAPSELEGFEVGTEPHNLGKVFIDFSKRADRNLVSRYADNPETRERLHINNENKLAENVPLFRDIVILRDQNARLLGYKSHAEKRLQDRVAPSVQWVEEVLKQLRGELLPKGKEELDLLRAKKREHTGGAVVTDEIMPWDFNYYKRLVEEQQQIDQDKVSEYFPLHTTVAAMLRLFASFFQLQFEPIDLADLERFTWHKDVEAWSVWDNRENQKGAFVGYLYSDILYRQGKYKGNQNVNLQPVSALHPAHGQSYLTKPEQSYLKPDGSRVLPATILMCNFSPSTATGCALLKHHEVKTLFHELGHGIHDLLSRTRYTRFHAWRAPPDFAEALSTMLENWTWMSEELKEMSCHYTQLGPEYMDRWKVQHPNSPPPGAKIPEEVLERLIGSRGLFRAQATSIFDITVHNPISHEEILKLDAAQLYNEITEDVTMLRDPDKSTRGPAHCHFGHLMSGYDAGYFSYI